MHFYKNKTKPNQTGRWCSDLLARKRSNKLKQNEQSEHSLFEIVILYLIWTESGRQSRHRQQRQVVGNVFMWRSLGAQRSQQL